MIIYWDTMKGDAAAACDLPTEANVRLGVVYDNGLKTGTYDLISGLSSDKSDSAAYVNILAVLNALFTSGNGWLQIPNPYDIESNASSFLRQGFGVAFGPAQNTNLELSCALTTNRTLSVVISRETFKTDGDYQGYIDVTSDLLDDLRALIKELETNVTLNDGQIFCTYESDSGVQSLSGDDFSCMYVVATFTAKIFDDLNN